MKSRLNSAIIESKQRQCAHFGPGEEEALLVDSLADFLPVVVHLTGCNAAPSEPVIEELAGALELKAL